MMPTTRKSQTFLVTKAFDHAPKPNVVRSFRPGQIVRGLTRAAILKGTSFGALKSLAKES
jgi:hypothetical protein